MRVNRLKIGNKSDKKEEINNNKTRKYAKERMGKKIICKGNEDNQTAMRGIG